MLLGVPIHIERKCRRIAIKLQLTGKLRLILCFYLLADDTYIHYEDGKWPYLTKTDIEDFKLVMKWLNANKL